MALAQRSQWDVAVMIFSDQGYQSDTATGKPQILDRFHRGSSARSFRSKLRTIPVCAHSVHFSAHEVWPGTRCNKEYFVESTG